MERKRLLYLISATFLSSLSLLAMLTGLQEEKAMAAQPPAANGVLATISPGQEVLTHTIYLPLVVRSPYAQPFGITMYGDVSNVAGLRVMEDAGCKWVVTMLRWSAIEPSPPVGGAHTYNWSSFDTKVANAKAAGMKVFVLFHSNPSWAAAFPGGPVYNIQNLVDMATAMADRYNCDGFQDAPGSPCVEDWSFYGEPDNGSSAYAQQVGCGYWGHNGAGYAAMLAQVSSAIHAVNPRARVLIGPLAYDWFEEEGGPFVRSFLSETLNALNAYPGGARAYIDVMAFQFYPISTTRWPTIREKALSVRGIMEAHGVGGLPLICPEMGYWSSYKWGSSESRQAEHLVQTYTRGLSVGVRPLVWHRVYDSAVAGSAKDDKPHRTFGLIRVGGGRKPSYQAYKTLAHELSASSYVRTMDVPGIEGYVFWMANGREKTVLWATDEAITVSFPYAQLRLVDVDGAERIITGGQSMGARNEGMDGQTAIRVYRNSVLYVEPYP